MVAGYHVIFGAYGFWLPNDPRGSWSDFVGAWEIFRFGPATTVSTRRSVAATKHDRTARLAAKTVLKRSPVRFTGVQARAIGQAFAEYAEKAKVQIWACAILPEHIHLVVGPLNMDVEQLVIQLKAAATRKMDKDGIHPFQSLRTKAGRPCKCFARGEWKVFLDPPDIPRAIRYVERNPEKERFPAQQWRCITPYPG